MFKLLLRMPLTKTMIPNFIEFNPLQGIPLDVLADAATNDGETFYPHVEKHFEQYPIVKEWIDTILYDSACDNNLMIRLWLNDIKQL